VGRWGGKSKAKGKLQKAKGKSGTALFAFPGVHAPLQRICLLPCLSLGGRLGVHFAPPAPIERDVPFAFCLLPFAFCLLPFAFCLLPFAFCLLPFAFYLLPSAFCFLPTAFFPALLT
jgi:hypothetical protein